jgi:hypothetical protein
MQYRQRPLLLDGSTSVNDENKTRPVTANGRFSEGGNCIVTQSGAPTEKQEKTLHRRHRWIVCASRNPVPSEVAD